MADVAQLSTSLRRGTLEFCVLAMVEHEDRYGTEIVRRFGEERFLDQWERLLVDGVTAARGGG